MSTYNDARLRQVNDRPEQFAGRYVLYWSQMYRRLSHNHALDYALSRAVALNRPLVVYEGLRLDYPWASARHHQFILQGMADNAGRARAIGINYWPFVETPDNRAAGLLRKLAADACLIVTDDFPAFIAPRQTAAVALRSPARVVAVDGNSIVPLCLLGPAVSAAAHLRPRIHKAFTEAWQHRACAEPVFSKVTSGTIDPPFTLWAPANIEEFVAGLPIDQSVRPVAELTGGATAARTKLDVFRKERLRGYAEKRSAPCPPEEGHSSELSAHLHYGHVSIEEIIARVLGRWSPDKLNLACRGKREGYYSDDLDVNSFLDEAITWRDVGFQWHWHRAADTRSLESALPTWAMKTLDAHAADRREHLYALEQFESADTHDSLWNAAQTELVKTGRVQNYLRMLWGKKILEWTESPGEAYRIMVHLNNKYAVDGRDPNSYTGILWCFGLFDRPWAPERPVYGTVRYMSSDNTGRKFKLAGYLEYVRGLSGPGTGRKSLF
ncbi:MAG: deoxyribodipyrimidine photolyase [Gemmataceae bacterium]|nr:deoxyribodipyrimidine photolyase [Gemmataceae bacterium]